MNRKDLFACPFWFDKIELDTEQVDNAIKSTPCYLAMSVDENVLDTTFKFLFDPINERVYKAMDQMGFLNYSIFTSWMTKTVAGYRHELDHMHYNSLLSGVVYLTDNPSPLLFRHPMPWRWLSGPNNEKSLNSNKFTLTPKKGDIVLFPSHIHHLILPHKNVATVNGFPTFAVQSDRCSIAFNVHPTGQYGIRDSRINVSIHPNEK